MVKKLITRKKFITSAAAGIAGIRLVNYPLNDFFDFSSGMRALGKTGISVTPVCFGAPRTNEESLIRYAVDKGINFIDTGRSYGNGNNEKLVGKAVEGKRSRIVIQSKMRLESDEIPAGGKGRKGADEINDILSGKLEASLNALNTDYIDILLIHDAADENILFHDATLKFFSESKKSGVIKASGYSSHNDKMHLHEINNMGKFYDVIMVPFNHKGSFVHSVNQSYSEWDQERLISLLEEAGSAGIGIVAMKTCSAGIYSPASGIKPGFSEAVRWVLQKEYISSAAVAMANFEEVNEHLSLIR